MRGEGRAGGGGLEHWRWGLDRRTVCMLVFGGGSPLMHNGMGIGARGDCGEDDSRGKRFLW